MQPEPRQRYGGQMADEDREQQALKTKAEVAPDSDEEDEDDIASPLDHPAFLPVLLWAGVLWFGYDGWLNPAYQEGGDKHDSMAFSRYGFGVILAAALYYTYRLLGELREARESETKRDTRSRGE